MGGDTCDASGEWLARIRDEGGRALKSISTGLTSRARWSLPRRKSTTAVRVHRRASRSMARSSEHRLRWTRPSGSEQFNRCYESSELRALLATRGTGAAGGGGAYFNTNFLLQESSCAARNLSPVQRERCPISSDSYVNASQDKAFVQILFCKT